jgi:two-component sensor histidine kinase/putative methionine-R-sulfoxide reductase with GAF domain
VKGTAFKRPWPTRDKSGRAKEDTLRSLRAELRQEADTVEALERIGRVLANNEPGATALGEIAEIVRQVTRTDAAQFLMLQPDGETLVLEADTYEPEKVGRVSIKVGQGLTGWAARHRRAVAIRRQPWDDPRFLDYPGLEERSFQSLLCVPLIARGELVGVVNIRTRRQYGYAAREADVLARIAELVARAIHQRSREAILETRAERYRAVTEVTELISGSPYLEEILQLLVSFTAERLNYKVVTVRLLDEVRGELILRATQSTHYAYRKKRSIQVGESFAGRAVVEKRTLTSDDVLASPDYIGADMAEEQGLRSMACVPLLIRDKAIGVMTCYTEDVHTFTRVEIQALEALAKQAAIAIEHAKLQVRTTLMQEMHHRVKNSLQQVVSLLRLQLNDVGGKTVEEVVSDTVNRISAIASVHDLLSREDLDRVGIRTVAETLAGHQQQALLHPNRPLRIEVFGDDFPIGMNQATQTALILNELIQNAVEHGFTVDEPGRVDISIALKETTLCIWVANSGNLLSEHFNIESHGHLGLRIVDSLAKAIGGRFTMTNKFGWVVAQIVLPRDETDQG